MTTPDAMNGLVEEIRDRFQRARSNAIETGKAASGSWGAGYDLGYGDALGELLEHITGEPSTASMP